MKTRYEKSVEMFLSVVDELNYKLHQWEDLDEVVSEWLQFIYREGNTSLSLVMR